MHTRESVCTPRRPRCLFYASTGSNSDGDGPGKNSGGGFTMDWQEELQMLLDPSMSVSAKQVLIQDFAKRLPEVLNSPCASGLKDVFRQLTDDVIPDLVTNGPKYVSRAMDATTTPRTPKSPIPPPESFSPPSVNMEDVSREVRNVFNRTPEGLFTPAFDVLKKTDEYDIRRYGTVIVAETQMKAKDVTEGDSAAAMGQSFNTLAGYLFGGNATKTSMKMTTPVMLNKATTESDSMSFIIGEYASVDEVPKTLDESVVLREEPGRTYASVEFSGFVTVGEAKRQRERLVRALEKDGVKLTALGKDQYKCMIYNGPSTLPNLRRNELMIEVEYGESTDEEGQN